MMLVIKETINFITPLGIIKRPLDGAVKTVKAIKRQSIFFLTLFLLLATRCISM